MNQNNGVRIEALDGVGRKIQYFGIIEEIWELDYGKDITVALFQCCWIKQHQLNETRLRVQDLENLSYQEDLWVLASRVAQVFYMSNSQSNLFPKKKTKHMVAFEKHHIIGVDGVDDVEAYNNYDEMPLFTDFPKKINVMEKNLPKDIMPCERKCFNRKVVTAG